MTHERVYEHFYRTHRMGGRQVEGSFPLSDGGGPFGFDIEAAVAFDYLVGAYEPDVIVETGCHLGDTTHYLARAYPDVTVHSCDINPVHVDFTRRRTARLPNCWVRECDSRALLDEVLAGAERPLIHLDAHGFEDWPLREELTAVKNGVVCVDDFDIGAPGWSYDTYGGVACGPGLIRALDLNLAGAYVNSTENVYGYPCLQPGRRAGRAYLVLGDLPDLLRHRKYFSPLALDS
ncbi:hypothetical protein [Streptomyces sp. NPDC058964]|uniref:hypothetical protein n=1 Tax=Streptomyces sp. NPDC058964 TaxID=3346681 RepID=UPI00368BDC08